MPVRNSRQTSTAAMPPNPQLRVNLTVRAGMVGGWRCRTKSVNDRLEPCMDSDPPAEVDGCRNTIGKTAKHGTTTPPRGNAFLISAIAEE